MKLAFRRVLLTAGLMVARACAAGVGWEDFGGSGALTSDYVYHGISQTCGDPAVQGDVHYRSAGGQSPVEGFAGAWASAGLGQAACAKAREIDLYGGVSVAAGQDSTATLTYTHYGYPGGAYTLPRLSGYRYDYDTLEAQWAWQDAVFLTAAWTPDALRYEYHSVARDRSALTYGLQVRHPLTKALSVNAGAGYDQMADPSGTGYGFWDAGVDYGWGPVLLQAEYFGTADRARRLFGSYVAGNRASVSIVWRF